MQTCAKAEVELWVWHEILPLFDRGKTLEVRIDFKDYRREIAVGTVIIFNQRVRRRVLCIRKYISAEAMLGVENADHIYPGKTKSRILNFFTVRNSSVQRHGILVFELGEVASSLHRLT